MSRLKDLWAWRREGGCRATTSPLRVLFIRSFRSISIYIWELPFHGAIDIFAGSMGAATATAVQSRSQLYELTSHGLQNLHIIGGGVDTNRFKPESRTQNVVPKLLFVGRVSKEKNIEDFLAVRIPCEKTVVGDGPHLNDLREAYPTVHFVGYKQGTDLIQEYVQADCLVFPSRTDTFGLVIAEAMACGTPIAAYPVTGPIDTVTQGITGFLHEDLNVAIQKSLALNRSDCRQAALKYSWTAVAKQFLELNQMASGMREFPEVV